MEIPTEAEWPYDRDDLDAAWARKNFLGKTFDEAVRLFAENAIHYQEDLMYMPTPVFGFYLQAYIAYLRSEAARDDSDGASCFVSLIRFKAEHDREQIVPYWAEIEPALRFLVEHQDDFDPDREIYGCFRSKVHEIVGYGFETTFDTSVLPDFMTLRAMAYARHILPWPLAAQVFRRSGFEGIEDTANKADILRIFGPPHASGGGEHPRFGHKPDWIRYHLPAGTVRFGFVGDAIDVVSFMLDSIERDPD